MTLRIWRFKMRMVKAYTKSEARAIIKKQCGFKRRLPAGIKIEEVR